MWFWKRNFTERPKPEVIEATCTYKTNLVDENGAPSKGRVMELHIASFFTVGGIRGVHVESTGEWAVKSHYSLLQDSVNWRVHGELPKEAKRVAVKGDVVPLRLLETKVEK